MYFKGSKLLKDISICNRTPISIRESKGGWKKLKGQENRQNRGMHFEASVTSHWRMILQQCKGFTPVIEAPLERNPADLLWFWKKDSWHFSTIMAPCMQAALKFSHSFSAAQLTPSAVIQQLAILLNSKINTEQVHWKRWAQIAEMQQIVKTYFGYYLEKFWEGISS